METHEKKTNWLAVVSIFLALLLAVQTFAFIYLLKERKTDPVKSEKIDSIDRQSYRQPAYTRRAQPVYAVDSWPTFDDMQEDMLRMMSGFMAGLPARVSQMNQQMGIDAMPLVDMEEKNNAYVVRVDMPGLDKNKIEITVRGEILTIHGVRETVNENQSSNYYTQERSYGSFARSLRLPGPVDETNVKADYQNGVLTITLPKISEEASSKKVSVA